eukprot:CAMPEP_0167762274 /NCGR_PEP_ID=MMETSP0110_2-20121227/12672_1 /TAXON_ID=629695 /ORGANISM="Gymnochlora sp., Strain CCMP2014" /LENGTH=602 /DNA_ID=CAMNT_0007649121 /DNA_START=152 /DNA_END=1960 /DNA_ORIENTATION=-
MKVSTSAKVNARNQIFKALNQKLQPESRASVSGLRGGATATGVATTVQNTEPFEGQMPGTSGLRKKVKVFQEPRYLENFVQAIFDTNPELKGETLVLGGDGRFFNDKASLTIVKMAAANGIGRVITAKDFVASTPAISSIVRDSKAKGAIILTASHNPGGPDEDFGIKYNTANGGPAPNAVTDKIYEQTKKISSYKISEESLDPLLFKEAGSFEFCGMKVDVMDAVGAYSGLMKKIFDFPKIKALLKRSDFRMVFDGMHGVSGPFAKRIFEVDLEAPGSVINGEPLPDFGGGHPDPNLKYATDLVEAMKLAPDAKIEDDTPEFGAAADGDGDRNMIAGKGFFVTPSDSLAVIAANAKDAIPYFKNGLSGIARSMPTSGAVDSVAKSLGIDFYEVPTGWKFFGNLMDDGKISMCGEESFGTGSDHIREKDGIWAVLAWLSIIAHRNSDPSKPLMSVKDIVSEHWSKFGRSFYTRYDYEGVDSEKANSMMDHMRKSLDELKNSMEGLVTADDFQYTDPVDGSIAKSQGIRFVFNDNSRIIFRLSGTGSVGATIRMYIEACAATGGDNDSSKIPTSEAVAPLVALGLKISKLTEFTGRTEPTVIT